MANKIYTILRNTKGLEPYCSSGGADKEETIEMFLADDDAADIIEIDTEARTAVFLERPKPLLEDGVYMVEIAGNIGAAFLSDNGTKYRHWEAADKMNFNPKVMKILHRMVKEMERSDDK